jgi:hypothetical protein
MNDVMARLRKSRAIRLLRVVGAGSGGARLGSARRKGVGEDAKGSDWSRAGAAPGTVCPFTRVPARPPLAPDYSLLGRGRGGVRPDSVTTARWAAVRALIGDGKSWTWLDADAPSHAETAPRA